MKNWYRIIESQSGWDWKGTLDVVLFKPPAQAGPPPRASCLYDTSVKIHLVCVFRGEMQVICQCSEKTFCFSYLHSFFSVPVNQSQLASDHLCKGVMNSSPGKLIWVTGISENSLTMKEGVSEALEKENWVSFLSVFLIKSYCVEKGKISLQLWLSNYSSNQLGRQRRPSASMPPTRLFLWLSAVHLHWSKQLAAKGSTWNLLRLVFPLLRRKKLLLAFEWAFLNMLSGKKFEFPSQH